MPRFQPGQDPLGFYCDQIDLVIESGVNVHQQIRRLAQGTGISPMDQPTGAGQSFWAPNTLGQIVPSPWVVAFHDVNHFAPVD